MLWRFKSNPNLAKDPVAMRYRVTKEQLEKITKKPTNNDALNQMAEEQFRVYGKDGKEQFIKDFVHRDYKLMGMNYLGLPLTTINTMEDEELIETINSVLQELFGIDNYQLIINAHSQNVTDCIVDLLLAASVRMGKILISQPKATRSINLFKDTDGIIYLEFYSDNIPINDIDTGKPPSNIPGPMKALLQLIPDVNKPYYELVYLETDNEHIYKMCIGEDVTAQELIETYFSTTTQRLITQHETLTERYKHIDEANISLQAQLKVSHESNTTLANALKESQSKQLEQMELEKKNAELKIIAQQNIAEFAVQLQATQECNAMLAKQLDETQQRVEKLAAENNTLKEKIEHNDLINQINSTLFIFKWYQKELKKDIPTEFHANINDQAYKIYSEDAKEHADLSASTIKALRKYHSINILTAILNDDNKNALEKCQKLKDEYELHGHQKILEMSREHPVVKAIKSLISVLTVGTGFLFLFKTKGHTATRAVKTLFQQHSKEQDKNKAPGAGVNKP